MYIFIPRIPGCPGMTFTAVLLKTVQQTPECTTFSVNVNVHIASISPGRPLLKRWEWIAAPGFFLWLFHHWQSNTHDDLGPSPFPSRFRQISQVRWHNKWTEWKPITSSHTSNGCLQSIVTHVETVFCHRSNHGLCRHCLSTRLTWTADYRQLGHVNAKCPA